MVSDVFFSMSDRHFGGAPQVTEDTCSYHGYFEGSCGDQWVFRYDRGTGKALLNGGDLGIRNGAENDWAATIDVTYGRHDLVLDLAEGLWLASCLSACDLYAAAEHILAHTFLWTKPHGPDGALNTRVMAKQQCQTASHGR